MQASHWSDTFINHKACAPFLTKVGFHHKGGKAATQLRGGIKNTLYFGEVIGKGKTAFHFAELDYMENHYLGNCNIFQVGLHS
jgi:hypothetical protein